MILQIYVLTAMFHIPVTIQKTLVNPCSHHDDPTCQGHQERIWRYQKDLVPYSEYIVYPRTYKQDAHTKSKSMIPKYKSNTVDVMSSNKLLKRKEKKLLGFIFIPIIIAGTEVITAIIKKIGESRHRSKG